MNRLHLWLARIDRASLRERVLMFVAAALVLTMLWYELAMVPLEARRTLLGAELTALKSPGGASAEELASEYASRMSRETALRSAIAAADRDLMDARRGMIAPDDMVEVLTTVLKRQTNLSLVLIRNLPPEPLMPATLEPNGDSVPPASVADASAAAKSADRKLAPGDEGPYLHPVEIVLQGGYLDVLSYLKALEGQPLVFLWRRFEYSGRDRQPQYRIEFATVSMDPDWLGV
jgi:MSHA biogenesis protein MshJ